MMVKIINPKILDYLRSSKKSNSELIKIPLCEMFNLKPRTFSGRKSWKKAGNANPLPVKILDTRLERLLIETKRQTGAVHRHTVETAILKKIGESA